MVILLHCYYFDVAANDDTDNGDDKVLDDDTDDDDEVLDDDAELWNIAAGASSAQGRACLQVVFFQNPSHQSPTQKKRFEVK